MKQTISRSPSIGDCRRICAPDPTIKIDPDKIGELIGPGGKNIRPHYGDLGRRDQLTMTRRSTFAINGETRARARLREAVEGVRRSPEVGKIYNGVVKRIMDFGAFIEILPGKEGLCGISSKSPIGGSNWVGEVLHEGQEIPVKLLEVDKMGRLNLSYIDALDDRGESEPEPSAPRPNEQRMGKKGSSRGRRRRCHCSRRSCERRLGPS